MRSPVWAHRNILLSDIVERRVLQAAPSGIARRRHANGNPMKQFVVTLHGIAGGQKCLSSTRAVLEPHFNCVPVSYGEYSGRFAIAALKVIARPGVRNDFVRSKKTEIETRTAATAEAPHVVAHSFGTYLLGRLLDFHMSFGRLVLVGSVLPSRFDWNRLLKSRPKAFAAVQNEVAKTDAIGLLAGLARAVVPGLGDSVRRGFRGPRHLVHSLDGPTVPCQICASRPAPSPFVHNVALGDRFGHSDHFLGTQHARELWLPFLWGFPAGEFKEFLTLACEAARLDDEEALVELARVEHRLRTQRWSFARGALVDYVREYVQRFYELKGEALSAGELAEETSLSIRLMWGVIQDAVAECATWQAGGAESRARALHPYHAIKRVVTTRFELRNQGNVSN
jgi:hypothetical protein